MLLWNDLHPYNAIHTVDVPGELDLLRLGNIVDDTLESLGLTGLILDRDSATYRYEGGPAAAQVDTVTYDGDAEAALMGEIHRQLNTAFTPGGCATPFRFYVIDKNDSFYFGVSYFHLVAGAESIVLLMHDLVNAYLGRSARKLSAQIQRYPATYGPWLRRHPLVLLRKLANLPALYWNLEHTWRPRYKDEMDTNNGFSFFSLTPPQLDSLKSAGKSWGVTLNDLVLTILFRIFIPLTEHRALSSRRNRLSIGTVVNIRKDMGVDSGRAFGLFLGSFVVSHAVPEGTNLKTLARDVNRQTMRIKKTRRYMGSPVELASALRTLKILSTERKKKFYQKHHPLWGGVTNMNLNAIWPQSDNERPVNYIRAVSTGPATPLVLSITTVRDITNISISYRTTVYSEPDIEYVKNEFINQLQYLESKE